MELQNLADSVLLPVISTDKSNERWNKGRRRQQNILYISGRCRSVIKFARKHGCRRAMYVDDILEPGVIKGNADVVSAVTDIITGARAILSDFDMNYPEFVSAGRLMVTHINERLNARW